MKIRLTYNEKDIEWSIIGLDEYAKLIKSLNPKKKKKNFHTNNLKIGEFTTGCWFEYNSGYTRDIKYIVVKTKNKILGYKCKICVSHVDQDKLHKSVPALKMVKDKFKELQNGSFKTCFGTVEEKLLRCVPKQLYWSENARYVGPVNSVDFSSHYPASCCGTLPDSHTAIIKEGTVKPTKEYPFAFYINSGHIAIYKELDTHYWLCNRLPMRALFRMKTVRKLFDDRFQPLVKPEEDITVLMKASSYTLDSVWQYFYDTRKDDEDAKLTLVAAIGQMHRKLYNRDKYAHIAAVCIARANQKMLDLTAKLDLEEILQIQVDGVMYTGDKKIGIDTKYLGAPVQEAYHRPCRWERIGVYMIDLGDKMKVKCQGYDAMTDGRNPEDSTKFSDMDLWIKENNNGKEEINA